MKNVYMYTRVPRYSNTHGTQWTQQWHCARDVDNLYFVINYENTKIDTGTV